MSTGVSIVPVFRDFEEVTVDTVQRLVADIPESLRIWVGEIGIDPAQRHEAPGRIPFNQYGQALHRDPRRQPERNRADHDVDDRKDDRIQVAGVRPGQTVAHPVGPVHLF